MFAPPNSGIDSGEKPHFPFRKWRHRVEPDAWSRLPSNGFPDVGHDDCRPPFTQNHTLLSCGPSESDVRDNHATKKHAHNTGRVEQHASDPPVSDHPAALDRDDPVDAWPVLPLNVHPWHVLACVAPNADHALHTLSVPDDTTPASTRVLVSAPCINVVHVDATTLLDAPSEG